MWLIFALLSPILTPILLSTFTSGHGANIARGRRGSSGQASPSYVRHGDRHHKHRRPRALKHGEEAVFGRSQEGQEPATVQILKASKLALLSRI